MKKSSKRSGRKASAKRKPVPASDAPKKMSRRQFTRRVLSAGALAGLAGGITVFSVRSVRATMAEHDLSRIGDGVPVVVQIHDPQCSACVALQRQTRRAMKAFEGTDLRYLVADISTIKGEVFARRHRARHVTLLLFDADGGLQANLQGNRSAGELEQIFRRLVDRHGED